MIITIEGKMSEGKTTAAMKLCVGRKHVITDASFLNRSFFTNEFDIDTEVIIVDDVKRVDYEKTMDFFRKETLTIHRKFKPSLDIKMPDAILIIHPA